MKSLFDLLNSESNYLILRNWDDVFNENIYGDGHEDIDILCDNLDDFVKLTRAKRVHDNLFRDNFIVEWNNKRIRFDVRWVGDNYYPPEWAESMLKNRVYNDMGVYIPNQVDYCYSLMYHALFQKRALSSEYLTKVQNTYSTLCDKGCPKDETEVLDVLKVFMKNHLYEYVIPRDPAVYVNWKLVKQAPHDFQLRMMVKHFTYKLGRRFGISI